MKKETIILFKDLIQKEQLSVVREASEINKLINNTDGTIKKFNKNEILASFDANNIHIELIAPNDGYYTWIPLCNIIDMDSIACTCYPSEAIAKHYGAIPEFHVDKDPVNSTYSIIWDSVFSFCDMGCMTFFPIVFGFNIIDGKPIIYFHNEHSPIAEKGDNIKFVLSRTRFINDDKEIKTVKVADRQLTLHNGYSSYRTTYAYLDRDTILSLMCLNLCCLQIDYNDDEPVNFKVAGGITSLLPLEVEQYRIKVFTNIFTEILDELSINWLESTPINIDNGKECYVYLMKDLTNNCFKIGMSNSPEYREKTLQSEKPEIELLCAKKFPNRDIAKAIESSLHSVYHSKHVRGEWFALTESDVTDIVETLS